MARAAEKCDVSRNSLRQHLVIAADLVNPARVKMAIWNESRDKNQSPTTGCAR